MTGAHFQINVGHEASGKPDFPIPAPIGTGAQRLAQRGATITYRVPHPGTTKLIARHTRYCNGTGKISSCIVAVINVKPD